ncbi:hydrogenase expression/formation protein [Phaeobacter gallaeciensis]|uniref:hydrogenase expression/formation protein n=1 Tax=Phaeobacter gallaeciensis TaxID=60890 RepID=UPI00237F101B|nr:hydrogenase expression/formation protein [Phaeobacter gallaeciensis]MDE4099999.1 hydrogenase expression/formation protein [Phaeobacter gallaeciensis]MDE4108809.1 hydrogenase expression/formation protein [Phaeobacter gallaeciensis]MDE4113255.1 hydrogenase expression/formation protein [Phaeobacter gallaeciensis]MDE4117696.1 hydrogenase expression/formation protein [Phaeobacter gallaeciensis]MDE4122199.1 hydrogenase expression/formation protein [Phaeobacter gallaeciensis]
MTNPFMMPPTGFGPGSQPLDQQDETLEYMPLPQDMRTYAPRIPDIEPLAENDLSEALDLLQDVAAAASRISGAGGTARFDLGSLDAANQALIAETLGSGEVAAKIRAIPAIAAQESVFAGIWMLKSAEADRIEVAAVPGCITDNAFAPHRAAGGSDTARAPGVVNAPPLLVELADKSASFDADAPLHVINLSLLPHTEEDLAWLDTAVGEGAVTMLSRGYGNCRITATAIPHVWRVQFFNSQDTLILDTFEVTTVPEVACAAPEDLADSAKRLVQVLEAIQ